MLFPLLLMLIAVSAPASAEDIPEMLIQAGRHLADGQYREAMAVYDGILEISPDNIEALSMKGAALEIQGRHAESLKYLFMALQRSPDNAAVLAGIGAGLGNLGEYAEGVKYLARAQKERPGSIIIGNYYDIVENIVSKYPYTPTEKPERDVSGLVSAPEWLRHPAKWWSEERLADGEWEAMLSHLIQNSLVRVWPADGIYMTPEQARNTAGMWADRQADNAAFGEVIQYLVQEGQVAEKYDEALLQESMEYEYYLFEKYLREIQWNISKEKRYIESPNPSQDVIKKFLRDYVKWNFEEQSMTMPSAFPEPAYDVVNGTVVIEYLIFVNEQPTGLPLDHVRTLRDSIAFWEGLDLETGGQKAKVRFAITNSKSDANVWVTWVVRDLGEGVLGHAHLGKGIVEVALGDYGCDGTFQLYNIGTVSTIMTHELGHSIGLRHSEDRKDIMYPSIAPSYAYCLLALAG